MPGLNAERFMAAAAGAGFRLCIGVPCSHLGPLIDAAPGAMRYIPACNEGDAVAMAAGAVLGGQAAMVLLQNSGLGNAVNPLSSLHQVARIPTLLIISWRGEPAGVASDALSTDEPQHRLMGAITPRLLDLLEIPWAYFPQDEHAASAALALAVATLAEQRPFAFIVKKGTFARCTPSLSASPLLFPRREYLAEIQQQARDSDVVVATTGYTGRELEALADRPNQFYLVGAMGCASSLGLGLAIAQPNRRILVLDGDGAALMRLSALASIGSERPANLHHLIFDNGAYESTGGQVTISARVDLTAIAAACGYTRVFSISSPAELSALLSEPITALTLYHIKTALLVAPNLRRPALSPPEVTVRLQKWLQA